MIFPSNARLSHPLWIWSNFLQEVDEAQSCPGPHRISYATRRRTALHILESISFLFELIFFCTFSRHAPLFFLATHRSKSNLAARQKAWPASGNSSSTLGLLAAM